MGWILNKAKFVTCSHETGSTFFTTFYYWLFPATNGGNAPVFWPIKTNRRHGHSN